MTERLRQVERLTVLRNRPVIKLRELRGIRDLEAARLLEDRVSRREHNHEFDEKCDRLSRELFGITEHDTVLPYPDPKYDGADYDANVLAFNAHEAKFGSETVSERDLVSYFLNLKWDLLDDASHPLRVAKYFYRQIEAVSQGLMGAMPDVPAMEAENWGAGLAAEAAGFRRKRT